MTPKIYHQIHFDIQEEFYDLAVGCLYDFPITGIEEGLDELTVTLVNGITAEDVSDEMLSRLHTMNIECKVKEVNHVVEQNWEKQWEESLQPIQVSDTIWITPSWKKDKIEGKYIIVIDPKMSFGTGYHPTTRMVCRMVEETVTPDSVWLDVGTGTGVLAILSVMAGAQSCVGFDVDEWSIENAQENVQINNVADKVSVIQGDVATYEYQDYDGIAANLYRNLLIPALPKFHKALMQKRGVLIVSGILIYDADEIIEEAQKVGFRLEKKTIEGEWCAIQFSIGE